MTEAIFDFADIKRRMDRKPAPAALMPIELTPAQQAVAALRAELDATERQIEDDGWITLWAY